MIKEYLHFLKDKSILTAILVLILIETFFQLGFYNKFLKKNSYASNVNKITEHAIAKQTELDPEILIVGTSLAYEGISLRLLNEKLSPLNLKAQSIAIPGSELIVQQLALRKALGKFKNVKYVIHVNEPEMPWTVGTEISLPTLAMTSALDRIDAIQTFKEYDYQITFGNISYLLIRLWAYRHDLADFILDPLKRIKSVGRAEAIHKENLYIYENSNLESLELYSFNNLKEAIEVTGYNSPIAIGSNEYHKEAIYKTCALAQDTNITLEETGSTKLFRKRISIFYKEIKSRNIKIINVFPPISNYVTHFNHEDRITFWKKHFKEELGEKILDLTDIIPQEKNASYFYDVVHPNQKGMFLFTKELGEALIGYLKEWAK